MSNKKLTDIEIENELNEFYANSESEEEFDFDETDEAVLDFGIESQEPVFQDFEINEAVKNVEFDNFEELFTISPLNFSPSQNGEDFQIDSEVNITNSPFNFSPSQNDFQIDSEENNLPASQTTTEICTKNVPRRKIPLSNPPKPIGPLKWKKTVNSFEPKIHSFTQNQVGIQKKEFDLNENSPVLDFFEAFITPNLMGKIVFETNRYALQQPPSSKHSRLAKWKDTSIDKMYIFLVVNFLMARNKKLEIRDYWSSNELLHQDIFSRLMSRHRYLLLLRLIHFCDSNQQIHGERLYKIQMVISEVKKNFKDALIPFFNLAIEESLLLLKGRLSFKQYIKSKRHRFGIKLYILCDCETDFILNFSIYTGATTYKDPLEDQIGKSGVIVKELLKPYFYLGHSLYTDNFYTSPSLAMYLHKKKTNTCGTVRKNRKFMPDLQSKLKLGERKSMCTNKLLAIHWKDRRDVYMLTTMHKDKMLTTKKIDRATGKKSLKPECVVSYNANMGAIDKTDMLLSSVECVRRTMKWYKKLFFHLIEMSLLNAYSAYKTVTGKYISLADFQLNLINELILKYQIKGVKETNRRKKPMDTLEKRLQLDARHFPELVPLTPTKKKGRRFCYVCSHKKENKKRKDSMYCCMECDVGLCVTPCFKIYHTQREF